jgi:nucleoside-diphosphate-sugar epimerase
LTKRLAGFKPGVVIHLAAVAESIIPFDGLSELFPTNLTGTLNVLEAADALRVIFASSASIYGNTSGDGETSSWENVNPLGCYAGTKAVGELVCGSWARATGGFAACLRFGNVVGPGCHGVIEYLVRHALAHPDGSVPARLRGAGQIVRDYVTVEYVTAAAAAACETAIPDGRSVAYNVSSGVAMTNGSVASIVSDVLAKEGYQLQMDFGTPVAAEEPQITVLEAREAAAALGLRLPVRDELTSAMKAAVLCQLQGRNAG